MLRHVGRGQSHNDVGGVIMAERKDNNGGQNGEDQARLLIREILQHEPLTLEGAIKREQEAIQRLIQDYASATDEEIDKAFVSMARSQYASLFDGILLGLHAIKVERHLPPSPQRDQLLALLRHLVPPSKNTAQRSGIGDRNFIIWQLVFIAESIGGLDKTRNRAQRDVGGAHSACSLVADELKRSGY